MRAPQTSPQRSLHPDESPGLLLWRTTLAWQRLMNATLKPFKLTHVQFVILVSTWWLTRVAGESPNQARIAQHAGTDLMMTSQVLRTLEKKGFVIRRFDGEDGRARRIGITAAGARLAQRAVAAVEAADRSFFGSAEETRAALEVLTRLSAP